MRLISFEDYSRIFVGEFDSELLLNIAKLFQEMVLENEAFNTPTEQRFIACFMALIGKTSSFDFVLSFLEEKEREIVSKVVQAVVTSLKGEKEEGL